MYVFMGWFVNLAIISNVGDRIIDYMVDDETIEDIEEN